MKRILIALAVSSSLLILLAYLSKYPFNSQSSVARADTGQLISGTRRESQQPEYVRYELLFREMEYFKQKKMPQELLASKISTDYGFPSQSISVLEQVASLWAVEMRQLENRAKEIIERERAKYPEGVVKKGQPPPAVPADLILLQKERENAVLRRKQQLQLSISPEEFAVFQANFEKAFMVK